MDNNEYFKRCFLEAAQKQLQSDFESCSLYNHRLPPIQVLGETFPVIMTLRNSVEEIWDW